MPCVAPAAGRDGCDGRVVCVRRPPSSPPVGRPSRAQEEERRRARHSATVGQPRAPPGRPTLRTLCVCNPCTDRPGNGPGRGACEPTRTTGGRCSWASPGASRSGCWPVRNEPAWPDVEAGRGWTGAALASVHGGGRRRHAPGSPEPSERCDEVAPQQRKPDRPVGFRADPGCAPQAVGRDMGEGRRRRALTRTAPPSARPTSGVRVGTPSPRRADARTTTTSTRGRPPDQRENPQDLRSVQTGSGRASACPTCGWGGLRGTASVQERTTKDTRPGRTHRTTRTRVGCAVRRDAGTCPWSGLCVCGAARTGGVGGRDVPGPGSLYIVVLTRGNSPGGQVWQVAVWVLMRYLLLAPLP